MKGETILLVSKYKQARNESLLVLVLVGVTFSYIGLWQATETQVSVSFIIDKFLW